MLKQVAYTSNGSAQSGAPTDNSDLHFDATSSALDSARWGYPMSFCARHSQRLAPLPPNEVMFAFVQTAFPLMGAVYSFAEGGNNEGAGGPQRAESSADEVASK